MIKITITPNASQLASIQRTFTQAPDKVILGLRRALYREGVAILNASLPLVPVDTGALRSTGHVTLPKVEDGVVTVTVGYGGVAAQTMVGASGRTHEAGEPVGYAVFVHEDLDAHHTVGQAKFLEQPFLAARKGMADRVMSQFIRTIMTP